MDAIPTLEFEFRRDILSTVRYTLGVMPQKRRLTIPGNREWIQQTFDSTEASLKRLSSTLYHFAKAGNPMRHAASDLLSRFKAIDKQLREKIKNKDRYI